MVQSVAVSLIEGVVLLGREVVLAELLPWIVPTTGSSRLGRRASRCRRSPGRSRPPGMVMPVRPSASWPVPLLERVVGLVERDRRPCWRSRCRRSGRWRSWRARPLLEVEGLVDRAVEVEHEMDAQAALVVEHFEAAPAGAADVEVDDELVDDAAEQRRGPSRRRGLARPVRASSPFEPHPVAVGAARASIRHRVSSPMTASAIGTNRRSTR